MATIFDGEPRFTNDIDVVVELPARRVAELCAAFPAEEFHVRLEAAREAAQRHSQFNISPPRAGLKVDLRVASGDRFDRSRFARGRRLHPPPAPPTR